MEKCVFTPSLSNVTVPVCPQQQKNKKVNIESMLKRMIKYPFNFNLIADYCCMFLQWHHVNRRTSPLIHL